MEVLVIVASICFILNKLFLLAETKGVEKTKWFFGTIGAILFIIYFFGIGSPMLSTLEMGLTILTIYRFIVGVKRSEYIEKLLGIVVGLVVVILFVITYKGYMEALQLFGSLGMLFGTFYLIKDQQKMGFTLYALGHIFLTIFGWQKGENIFWELQLVQALLCLTIFVSNKEPLDLRGWVISFIIAIYAGIECYINNLF